MDILQTWLEGSDVPVLTAFILGLLTAVSPCPLATNITAIGFIGKDIHLWSPLYLGAHRGIFLTGCIAHIHAPKRF